MKLEEYERDRTAELGRVVVERPALPKSKSIVVRFMEKVDVRPDDCWIWQGEVSANGYGGFRHPETKWAHRAAYLLFRGPIPDDQTVDHLCYVKRCVKPDHLSLTSAVDNRRRESRGISECESRHPDTPTRLGQKRSGRVHCKECHRIRELARRARVSGDSAPRLPYEDGLETQSVQVRGGSSVVRAGDS